MSTVPATIKKPRAVPWSALGAASAALLGASFAYVQYKKFETERDNPPRGRFIDVDGVRLHYVERGQGPALVLLHGNGVSSVDMEASGLMDRAAQRYRVIAFDRPGFGYSKRPGGREWTPEAQALLIYRACHQLDVEHPIVLGHSWGTLVALAMALDYPKYTRAVALMSGYFYPSLRLDTLPASLPAAPIVGALMRYTISPLLGRLMWPSLVHTMFSPAKVAPAFERQAAWMSLRPTQVGASAAESAMMVPAAARLAARYAELTMPVSVIAGDRDKIANCHENSQRLAHDISHSSLAVVQGAGHMVHYASLDTIMASIDALSQPGGVAQASRGSDLAPLCS